MSDGSIEVGTRDLIQVLSQYEPPKDATSRVAKAAHCLNWCAEKLPYAIIPHNFLVRAIDQLTRTPNAATKDVIQMARNAGAVRKKCMELYKRGVCTLKGVGMRATVNSDDIAGTQYVRQMGRVVSAQQAAGKTAELIKPGEMKNAALRNYVTTSRKLLTEMNTEERLAKLLPPKNEKK